MAQMQTVQEYHLKVSDREIRLIGLALAAFAGKPIKGDKLDKEQAAQLNVRLMEQRAISLREQLVVAEGNLHHAKEPVPLGAAEEA